MTGNVVHLRRGTPPPGKPLECPRDKSRTFFVRAEAGGRVLAIICATCGGGATVRDGFVGVGGRPADTPPEVGGDA